jgi:TIR domain
MRSKVFISYRRDDSKYQARMIHAAFCQVLPREHVFMDIDSIPPGSHFRKILKDWVNECEVLLALIGPGWINAIDPKTSSRRLDNPSDFVRIEIGEALARDIPVVPVLIDGTPMPDIDLLPNGLKELVDRMAESVEYRTFDADVERLIKKLRLTQRPVQTVPAQPAIAPPHHALVEDRMRAIEIYMVFRELLVAVGEKDEVEVEFRKSSAASAHSPFLFDAQLGAYLAELLKEAFHIKETAKLLRNEAAWPSLADRSAGAARFGQAKLRFLNRIEELENTLRAFST